MATNPFDAFDKTASTSNPFDKFDATATAAPVDFSVPTKENLAESERQAKERARVYKKQEPGVVEQVLASPEVPLSLMQNIPVSLAGAVATGGKAEPMADFMQKYGYQFKTRGGQAVGEKLGKALEGLPPVLGMGGSVQGAMQTAVPAARQVAAIPAVQQAVSKAEALGQGLKTKIPSLPSIPTVAKSEAKASELSKALKTTEPIAKTSERIKRGEQETRLRGAEKEFMSEADKKRQESAREFAGLGKPQAVAKLGDEMQDRIYGTKFRRAGERSRQAANDAVAYFEQADKKGEFIRSDVGKSFLSSLRNKIFSQATIPSERAIAEQMYRDLSEARNIRAVEKTFRKYNEISSGPPKEGFDAVTQQFAGKIAGDLSESLNQFAPKRLEFRKTYKELSSPLDAYETSFGKRAIAEEGAVPGELKMMPSDLPSNYFKNRDTINVLREQLAGDEAAVRKFANQYAVNELEGRSAQQAQTWFNNNRSWVDTVEGLNVRVERYIANLASREAEAKKL